MFAMFHTGVVKFKDVETRTSEIGVEDVSFDSIVMQ